MTRNGREDAYIDAILRWQDGLRFPVAEHPDLSGHTLNHKFLRAGLGALAGHRGLLLELCRAPLGAQGELGDAYDAFRIGAVAVGLGAALEVVEADGDARDRERAAEDAQAMFRRLDAEVSLLRLHKATRGRVVMPGDRLYWLHDLYTDALLRWVETGYHGLNSRQYGWQDPTFGIRQLERTARRLRPNPYRADLVRTAVRLEYTVTKRGVTSVLPDGITSTNHTVFAVSWGPHAPARLSPSSGLADQADTRMVGPVRVWRERRRVHAEGLAQRIDRQLRPLAEPERWHDSIPESGGRVLRTGWFDEDGPHEVSAA